MGSNTMQNDNYSDNARSEGYEAVSLQMHIIVSVLEGQFCKHTNMKQACHSMKGSSALS